MLAKVSSACSVSWRERRTRAWAWLTASATGTTAITFHGWLSAKSARIAPSPASAAAAAKSGWQHLEPADDLQQPARDEQVDEREHGQRDEVVRERRGVRP